MSLKQRLIEQITLDGPISVADYMARCLLDPRDGYYTRHVAIGEDGDFITAPLISQIFGEMIGIWAAEVWRGMGSPGRFRLVEVGGGDGTLMSDIRRVVGRVAGMAEAMRLTLVEPSPILRERQAKRLGDADFAGDIGSLPSDMPVILVANEVLDCLPVRQFVRTGEGWRERLVGVRGGELAFGLAMAVSDPALLPPEAREGEIGEVSAAQAGFLLSLGRVLRQTRGAALLIDYGRDRRETGDTLQALHRHKRCPPLASPGDHDLTAWANMQLIDELFCNTDIKYSAISTQSEFLVAMGARARYQGLVAANPDRAATLERQYNHLTAPDQMGTLFKVAALAFPLSVPLPGLETVSGRG